MLKKILLGFAALFLLAVAVVGWRVWPIYQLSREISPSTAPDDYAKQDDSRVQLPTPRALEPRHFDPLKNVYWGEVHVHTVESLDAVLFGTTATIEDAYRFARGEPLRSPGGELMQLSRPLDFMAITDHAEGFGLGTRCAEPDLRLAGRAMCGFMRTPGFAAATFLRNRQTRMAVEPDPTQPAGVYRNRPRSRQQREDNPICGGEGGRERCLRAGRSDWARYIELADRHNEPGVFTTFAGYEFSPVLEGAGKHHRNVIFNGDDLPAHAISSQDVGSATELWRGLEETCTGRCDFLTIPHNMNKGWGLFYSRHTWDGGTYSEDDWRLRMRREPLAEMYQVKGTSECALGVGATDEECAFEQVLEPCEQGQETGCAFESSFARQGLQIGMQLEREYGFNPLAFGFVAATDAHNANPGDVEEWDFPGKVGAVSSPAVRRLRTRPGAEPHNQILTDHGSGGLAAVWAEENTRDAIFAGMKRREAYATSGPRIVLRFFAGWGFDAAIADARNPVAVATEGGIPMGGVLRPEDEGAGSPTFFVWAGADLMSAPLQRIQIVKGWIDAEGETHEWVRDVVCADGLEVDPNTLRCPDNGASVDTRSCQTRGESGARQLMVAWQDEDFDASQGAFYYVRAIQNPTCRWSTYDAIRLGIEPDPRVPATIRERAWSSPIWIDPPS
ncbi:MAG: DUF3604 domain-containing protein [Deltaproteobacteria bacterium]|nr:DUF3604 domain-containing protein [Deltaproteobacteria bacterium]